jgi:CO dehydrogenase/acetyl-CoA synthase delta subunit
MFRVNMKGVTKMSDDNKTPENSSAGATTNEGDEVQAFGTPITVGGDGRPAPAAVTGTPITVGGDGSPQQQ